MYKSKLQELCQRQRWNLPEYNTVQKGPDHMPRFTATVSVRGQLFETPTPCNSSKVAQNTVAKIALDHFNPNAPPPTASAPATADSLPAPAPPSLVPSVIPPPETAVVAQDSTSLPASPLPSSLPLPRGLLAEKNDASLNPDNGVVLQQNCAGLSPTNKVVQQHNSEDTEHTSSVYRMAIGVQDKSYKETLHMYKNRLQQYAQKHNLGFPVYTCEVEGPPHNRRFKSRVSLDGKSYETLEFFSTLKEAEQAAAKIACQVLSVDEVQEDGGLYKNLLQEFGQKKGLMCPSYETVSSGMSHNPVFVSTVQIGDNTFEGAAARTKKQAEMNAAKVAYCALKESCPPTEPLLSPGATENMTIQTRPMNSSKKPLDGIDEEAQNQAKKAKTLAENVNMNASLPGLSNNSPVHLSLPTSQKENPNNFTLFTGESMSKRLPGKQRIVVMPRESDLPRPVCAEVLPISDDKYVAYKVPAAEETAP